MDPILLQKQLRDNTNDLQDFCNDLKEWSSEMKRKEESLKSDNSEIVSDLTSKLVMLLRNRFYYSLTIKFGSKKAIPVRAMPPQFHVSRIKLNPSIMPLGKSLMLKRSVIRLIRREVMLAIQNFQMNLMKA